MLGKAVPVDSAGHLRLSEVPLVGLLKKELQDRFAARGDSVTLVTLELGYELRSADPTPGDMAYCRSLGHGSVRLLINSADTVMIAMPTGGAQPPPRETRVGPPGVPAHIDATRGR